MAFLSFLKRKIINFICEYFLKYFAAHKQAEWMSISGLRIVYNLMSNDIDYFDCYKLLRSSIGGQTKHTNAGGRLSAKTEK